MAKGNPRNVALGSGILLIVFAAIMGWDYLQDRRVAQLIATGVAAKATVVKIIDTGSRSGHDPVCRVILSVKPAGKAAFQAETEMALSAVDLTNQFKVGAVVRVKFDPEDRSKLVVLR
jgi:hypothetical protein